MRLPTLTDKASPQILYPPRPFTGKIQRSTHSECANTMIMTLGRYKKVLGKSAWVVCVLCALLLGPAISAVLGADRDNNWRTASRESVGLAPTPSEHPEAIVQVYGARAFRWRGAFAVHTWIAIKPANAPFYQTAEVIGWGVRHGRSAIRIRTGQPDRKWFGAAPKFYADLRGKAAEDLIPKIVKAIESYPYPDQYRAWPGPNSNTFVAHVLRQAPELRADLPPHAIGKDFLPEAIAAVTPSGTGGQVSLFGVIGLAVGLEEGLELNLLGLNFGIDPGELALRLPGLGKIGLLNN